jgi:hypothetical protein
MSEKQFEAFDEWFKNAANEYEPPFNEEAWNKMEAKLDGQTKRRKRPLAWWWLTDALMVGIVLYMAFGPNKKLKKENGDVEIVSNILPQIKQSETNKEGLTSTGIDEVPKPVKDTKDKTENDSRTDKITNPEIKHSNKNNTTAGIHSKRVANYSTAPNWSKQTGVNEQELQMKNKSNDVPLTGLVNSKETLDRKNKNHTQNDVLDIATSQEAIINPEKKLSANTQNDEKDSTVNDPSNSTTKRDLFPANKKDTSISDSTVKSADESSTGNKAAKPNINNYKELNKGKLFVYAAVSPEWSFIFGNKTGKATMAYGLGVGYHIGNRWAVSAGFNITQKIYTAGKNDYAIKKGDYWDNPDIVINKIDADCRVFEIPISVRYYIQQQKNYTLFANIGFSTAIMKKEVYDYDYTKNGWQNAYSHTYTTGKSQFFSGALISIGYGRKLSNSFSLLAEPYFKMPLQGVGEGKVKIGSIGLSVGVQYTLPGSRK